ncbi:DNA oxidative demethylase AlkB [Dechloromonas sp. A34]|uniref:DNA oxidative demethylase AlkB n=1 Tax=Dechloromonas sp. A34 TaxID=447588 RepID=UPI0022487E28|nr:DNA oxidative demethylase AlkB [Dechloromonas sp. A34]
MGDLLAGIDRRTWTERLGPGTALLRGFALADDAAICAAIDQVVAAAPFRRMTTPGGFVMSVAMSNCGPLGWVTDASGYRYSATDPANGQPWPPLPALFLELAGDAAAAAGFPDFVPDACLINRYAVGARMSLHQDHDERDFTQPIVSVSLGLPATFLFGGLKRADPAQRIALTHGDAVVWGGPDRLRYHGVLAVKAGEHPLVGNCRLNLTFRKAR